MASDIQHGPDTEQLRFAEDAERLADVGDLILAGASIDEFDLRKWEHIVVESYVREASV